MSKKKKTVETTPVEAYEMHKEYSRPSLMTGEYSGINPEDLLGKPTPKVSYPLDRTGCDHQDATKRHQHA